MLTKNSDSIYPIISCLVAATLWGLLWYPLRILESMGMAGLWASILIYTATLMPLLPGLYSRRRELLHQPGTFLLLGISSGWANLGFILAVLEGNIVRVLLLFYLSPIWTVLLGRILLKERLSTRALLSVVLALTGAMTMLWTPDAGLPVPVATADVLAITAGMAFSVMNVFIRKSGDRPLVLKVGVTCIGVLLFSISCVLLLQPVVPDFTIVSTTIAVGTGLFGMLAMTYTAQYGVTHLPVHRSAVLFLFEIVAGAVSAALLTDETMTIREFLGGSLVVLSAWLAVQRRPVPRAVLSK